MLFYNLCSNNTRNHFYLPELILTRSFRGLDFFVSVEIEQSNFCSFLLPLERRPCFAPCHWDPYSLIRSDCKDSSVSYFCRRSGSAQNSSPRSLSYPMSGRDICTCPRLTRHMPQWTPKQEETWSRRSASGHCVMLRHLIRNTRTFLLL